MEFYLEKNSNIYLSANPSASNNDNNTFSHKEKPLFNFIIFISFLLLFIYLYSFIFKENQTIKISHFKSESKSEFISKIQIYKIDSNYKTVSPNDNEYIYIPVIGTNDFHGRFFPVINHYNNDNTNINIEYKTGGLEYISKYISVIKKEFGANRVLYFDSGDQFFQTNETILFDGNNIFEFLNTIGLNGTTLGNNDYLYRRKWIQNKIKKAKYPYLINNIKDIATNKVKGALGDNQDQSHLYEIKLDNNDIIKIGVIGLTMNIGVDKSFYNVGNRQTWNNISFLPYYTNLEQESKKLRDKGANAVLLVSHIGLLCSNVKETSIINMYTKNTPQTECEHKGDSLLYNFIENLKPGIIDAIIGGDTHNNVHHWVNDIPIMITKGMAKYVNIMYLPFKKENNEFKLFNNDIKIEGPLPSCEKIFTNLNHCDKINKDINTKNNIKLTNYYWHNEKMGSDEITKSLFDKYYDLYKKVGEKKIIKISGFTEKINIKKNGDCPLSNLLMDAIRNITGADLSIVNFWMFQNYLSPGYLSVLDFIKLIPHENYFCITPIKGKEIKKMIKVVQSGEKGFQPTSGLKQFIKINNITKKKEVIDIKLYSKDNKEVDIDDEKEYTLSSNNFVLSEYCEKEFAFKDSFDIIKSKIEKGTIKCSKINAYIEIMNYFKNMGNIDINRVVDMTKKRIVILNG